ncbi:MAG: hypothetical protein GY696_32365 [Gammaproteobacteria bacterium]|nr:hypothetical protein [Gammaproteobacteria bacterium]
MNLGIFYGNLDNVEYLRRQETFVSWLETEWNKAQELLENGPPFSNNYGHIEHLITNNTMCVLNTLTNRLLSTYGESDSRSSADNGGYVIDTQRAVMEYRHRNERDDLDNMWPAVGKHFSTNWESRGMKDMVMNNLEMCNTCWKSTYEHIDVPEYQLRDARRKSMRKLHWEYAAYLGGRLYVKTSFTP